MAYIVPKEMPKSCIGCVFSYLIEQHPFWSDEKEKRGTKILCCQAHTERRKLVLDINDKTTKASWCPLADAEDVKEVKCSSWEEVKTGDGLYDYRFKCPECKHLTIKGYVVAPDFCPGCGADMRGGKNG